MIDIMKTVAVVILLAVLTGCTNARIYAVCDKRVDKEGKVHYKCDKNHIIGFGYKF